MHYTLTCLALFLFIILGCQTPALRDESFKNVAMIGISDLDSIVAAGMNCLDGRSHATSVFYHHVTCQTGLLTL